MFAALGEFERELIIERTKAGLAAAKARGRMSGGLRKMNLPTLNMAMAAMQDRSSIARDVAKSLISQPLPFTSMLTVTALLKPAIKLLQKHSSSEFSKTTSSNQLTG